MLSLREEEYVQALRAFGLNTFTICFKHILPNALGPIMVNITLSTAMFILQEAGLSFLGLGVRPPTPSWGSILNDGYTYIRNSKWILISAGIPLILVTIGFTFLGEQLRDFFDPKIDRGSR